MSIQSEVKALYALLYIAQFSRASLDTGRTCIQDEPVIKNIFPGIAKIQEEPVHGMNLYRMNLEKIVFSKASKNLRP